MLYNLEQSETADFLKKMAVRLGQQVPDRIANAPELLPGLGLFMDAFYELDSERRNTSHSIGRIPWSKMILYADVNGFDDRQRKALVYCIKAMDSVYIKHFLKKTETA